MNSSDVKSLVIAITGTGVTVSLAHLLPIVSLCAGALTIVYTGMKIYDWVESRVEKRKAKHE